MKLWDRIVTLTANPAIDVALHADVLAHEALGRVLEEKEEAGGKGVNVSRLLGRLGVENQAVALCGEENFPRYQQLLGDQVALRPVLCRGKVRENLTLTSREGVRIKLDRPGSLKLEEGIAPLEQALGQALAGSQSPLLLFCGSLPGGISSREMTSLLERLQARFPLSLGLDTQSLCQDQLASLHPLFCKPNQEELAALFPGEPASREEDLSALAQRLCSRGVGTALVSLGERGLLAAREGRVLKIPGLSVPVRSTVAAGDSVMAGYAAALSWGKPWEEAVCFAAACGTAAVTHPGSGTGSPQEILSYFSQLTEMAGL